MTNTEYRPNSRQVKPTHQITPELIDYHIRYGNHLRAAAVAAAFSALVDRLAALLGFRAGPAKRIEETVADRFANGLAAIRSSAEILRDTPDLAANERARFLAIVLEEERRLARVLDSVPGLAGQPAPGR